MRYPFRHLNWSTGSLRCTLSPLRLHHRNVSRSPLHLPPTGRVVLMGPRNHLPMEHVLSIKDTCFGCLVARSFRPLLIRHGGYFPSCISCKFSDALLRSLAAKEVFDSRGTSNALSSSYALYPMTTVTAVESRYGMDGVSPCSSTQKDSQREQGQPFDSICHRIFYCEFQASSWLSAADSQTNCYPNGRAFYWNVFLGYEEY